MLKMSKKFLILPIMICVLIATLCTFGFAGCSTEKLTVTFDANGGYVVVDGKTQTTFTMEVEKGAKIDLTKLPDFKRDSNKTTKYDFDGWDYNINNATINESKTIKVVWKESARKYTVTFDANGGKFENNESIITKKDYEFGASLEQPKTPTKSEDNTYSYEFLGYDKTVSNKVDSDVTYTAQWKTKLREYTVTFNASEGQFANGETTYSISAKHYGDSIELPSDIQLTRTGDQENKYVFDGWCDKNGAKVTNVTGSDTVYACWKVEKQTYTITFNAGNGKFANGQSNIEKTFEYGSEITAPTDKPIQTDSQQYKYEFTGYKDLTLATTVKGNATFVAQYKGTLQAYTVTFDANGGYFDNTTETTKSYTLSYGAKVTVPANPTKSQSEKETFAFTSWTGYSEGATVTGNITYDANYSSTPRMYKVKFNAGENAKFANGETSLTKEFEFDKTITAPTEVPIKTSSESKTYTFSGYENLTSDTKVTGEDMQFTATYSASTRYYTITFNAGDGAFDTTKEGVSVDGKTYTVSATYNSSIERSSIATLTRKSDSYADYEFEGWGSISQVTADTTYTATYTATAKTYTAKFYKQSGDSQPIYTTVFTANSTGNPTLNEEQLLALENACGEDVGLLFKKNESTGFYDRKVFTLRNANIDFVLANYNECQTGNGTETSPYLIADLKSFEAMMTKLDTYYTQYNGTSIPAMQTVILNLASSVYYKMVADVDFTTYTGNSHPWFVGHLDAKKSDTENYAIKGLNPDRFVTSEGAIFEEIWNASVSNLDIVLGDKIASFAGYAYGTSVEFNNVDVYNAKANSYTLITSSDNNESAYLSQSWANNLTFEDCTNYASYVSEVSYFGIFLGGYTADYTKDTQKYQKYLTFKNCVNYGDVIASSWVGMLYGNPCNRNFTYVADKGEGNTLTVEGCVNYGSITAKSCGGFVGATGNGFTSQLQSDLNSLITNDTKDGKTGSFNNLKTTAGTLSTTDNKFTLSNTSDYAKGKYVLTLATYASSATNGTVRVNYSYEVELQTVSKNIEFGTRYDFIDKVSYEAKNLGFNFDSDDWEYMKGYNIKYAFDTTNNYIVFDFSEFYTTNDYVLNSSASYKAYITYYDTTGKLTSSAESTVSAYTRTNVATETVVNGNANN